MATRTVVCPDCSEPLMLGRLSCSNCGSLLASVTGAPRRTSPLRTVVVDEPDWLSDDDSLGWMVDEPAGHDTFDDHETRTWPEVVAPPTPDAGPPPIVVKPVPVDGDERARAARAEAVSAEPEANPERAPEPDTVTEPTSEPETQGDVGPEAVAEPVASPEAPAVTEPVPDADASPDVEPVAADEGADDETQLSWVDLRVAAVSGADAVAESEPPAAEADADAPAAPTDPADADAESAVAPGVDAAQAPEPVPEESPVEPDVPAAEPDGSAVESGRPEGEPEVPATEPVTVVPDAAPDELADEPVGAPGDVDDASEPPPPDVVPAGSVRPWPFAADDQPARPLQPSHTTRSRLDLGARPAADAASVPAWEPLDRDEPDATRHDDAPSPAGAWVPPTVEATPPPVAAAQPAPDPTARRSDLKLDAPDDLPTGLTVVGSGVATLGFLLPWAAALPGSTGWTDRWGLAEPSLLLVLLAAATLLGLNMVPNRLPAWVRAGALPLGLGGLLLGLVWPAMLGGSGMQLGAVAVTFAAFLLIAGGGVGVGRARQEASQPAV